MLPHTNREASRRDRRLRIERQIRHVYRIPGHARHNRRILNQTIRTAPRRRNARRHSGCYIRLRERLTYRIRLPIHKRRRRASQRRRGREGRGSGVRGIVVEILRLAVGAIVPEAGGAEEAGGFVGWWGADEAGEEAGRTGGGVAYDGELAEAEG